MKHDELNPARIYIKKIRNEAKKRYAEEFLAYLLNERQTLPEMPDNELGYMAQQAVRMNLRKLVPAEFITNPLERDEVVNDEPTNGDAQYWEKTEAGEQGVLIHTQRTASKLGKIKSNIPHADQIKGTMFDTMSNDKNQTSLF